MTEIIRADAPRQSTSAVIALAGLVFGSIMFSALAFLGIFLGWPDLGSFAFPPGVPSVGWVSIWLGLVFVLVAIYLDVYRREFVPDELIHKKRRPKIVPKRDIR